MLTGLGQKVLTTFYRRMVVVTKQVGPDVAVRRADIDAVIETLDASHLSAYLEFKPWVARAETERRLAQGHLCMAAWYQGKIVHAAWAAEKRAHIPYVHSDIVLEPKAFYIYDSYTRQEYRRSKLVMARSSTMHAHFAARGFTRGYGAIALMNKAGLSIVAPGGYHPIGMYICTMFGPLHRTWASQDGSEALPTLVSHE
ncbi:MAG: hypothetical protein ACSLFK_13105 [Gemmatimonadaceae bacterium]